MARLAFSPAPDLGGGAVYGEYMPWLLHDFYDRLCGYCLLHHLALTIDHYVPQAFDPTRAHDPENLLPACAACNRSKSDYHPEHVRRRRLRRDTTGYLPIDVRSEDLARFLALQPTGDLVTVDRATADRAGWFATVLLKLDLEPFRRARARICKVVDVAERLAASDVPEHEREPTLAVLVEQIAAQWLLLEALDYPVSATLREAVVERRMRDAAR